MPLTSFETFLNSIEIHPLIEPTISKDEYIAIDLSIYNTELKKINISSSNDLEEFIWNYLKLKNAKVTYGGYLEKRGIYQRSNYFNQKKTETERNIHLGLDLWIESETPIFAPLEGRIHSFKNNTNYGDYGPTIILEHNVDGTIFYTLYGHLSLDSIENLKIGVQVQQGEQIATLGTAEVNGDYPPHLHFQIIKDIENYKGDYPGVANQQNLDFFKENCPDPTLLLKLS